MAQRLIVIGDRLFVDVGNAERLGDLQRCRSLRQLPQATEQALRLSACEHELAAVLEPQRGAREDRQLALLLACCDDGKLVLPAGLSGNAPLDERAHEALR